MVLYMSENGKIKVVTIYSVIPMHNVLLPTFLWTLPFKPYYQATIVEILMNFPYGFYLFYFKLNT